MLKFYHAPWSRSSGVLWLLGELGVDYEMVDVDIRQEGGVPEDYRLIQPNKKVPAIEHDGIVVTERAAITIYQAWAFPAMELMPRHEERAPFLIWNVYCDSVFDPCAAARAHGLDYRSNDYSFGLFEDMVANVERHLKANDFAAGSRFTAADTQLASAVNYTMNVMPVLPKLPAFEAYLARIVDRPAYQQAQKLDYDLAMATPYFKPSAGAGNAPVDG